ncbi:LysR family transcriptional regulator [Reyranella sp. CPCC 100927]|uniref:LysR family transcriptional regulator n=1 Tax=Reyranella sp. CPCC 100927 TaxID=2599616 RepID=UPI0011B44594|nr:LysR family transcriptional regulator [Reyranella sp. CPCC 100927]TWT13593.1 LysR family transcriptional regulator [Reyranella sp. CPCC 100927]
MHPSRVDLNLLVVFEAIYAEGGVTPAGRRLNLTQPAVSHALSRLRSAVNDPLFVRQGQSIVPTPVARQMIGPVRQSLQGLGATLSRVSGFDPATARTRFTIGMRDVLESVVLPPLMKVVAQRAPFIDIAVVKSSRRELEMELAAGAIDVAIDVLLPVPNSVHRARIAPQPLAVIARRGHPQVKGKVDLETYLAQEHIVVSSRRRGQALEDYELSRRGLHRHVRLRCQHYFAAARVVSQTDLLCTMTEPLARILVKSSAAQVLPLPLKMPSFDTFLYWHAHAEEDPANRWLRAQLLDALEGARALRPRGA